MTTRQREWAAFRRDPYVRWVKSLRCAVCKASGPSEPDHFPTVGSTGTVHTDVWPLCSVHHIERHHDVERFQQRYGIQIGPFIAALKTFFKEGVAQKRLKLVA